MSFGNLATRKPADGQTANESPFVSLKEGNDVVLRILDQEPVEFWMYWFDVNAGGSRVGRSLIVARDNPIRKYMDSLGEDNPKHRKPSHRARVNVLDRTPDDKGNVANKVKILEYGSNLDKEFGALHGRARKRTDFSKKLNIWDFDILFITSGSGRDKVVKPMQHLDDDPLSPELLALPRYDLRQMCQPLPNEAIEALIDGRDYMEVMKSIGREGTYPMINP